MVKQSGWPTLMTSIVFAGITTATGAVINFATEGRGGALSWIALFALTLTAGALPYFSQRSLSLGRLAKARRSALLATLAVALVVILAADHAVPKESSSKPSNVAGPTPSTTTQSPRPNKPPLPLPKPGVARPHPLDPDSLAVAAQLTTALSQAGLIPDNLSIEGDEPDEKPLEFHIGQGQLRAVANLRDKRNRQTVFLLHITAGWLDASSARHTNTRCQEVINQGTGEYCETHVSQDGTEISEITRPDDQYGPPTSAFYSMTRPSGAYAQIGLMLIGSGAESFPTGAWVVNIATLVTSNLQQGS